MKSMKNIKPAYAVKLGNGVFVGPLWQCSKCGKTTTSPLKPSPGAYGKCPSTASGNHMWKKY